MTGELVSFVQGVWATLLHEGRVAVLVIVAIGISSTLALGSSRRCNVLFAWLLAVPVLDLFRRLIALNWVSQPAVFDVRALRIEIGEGIPTAGAGIPWDSYAATLWTAGVFVLGVRLLLGFVRWRRIVSHALPHPRLQALAEHLARAAGISRPVVALQSHVVRVPMTGGIRQPIIVFPPSLLAQDEGRVRAAMLHELGHVASRDIARILLTQVVATLHWWNPLIWWLRRRFLIAMELTADAFALRNGGSALHLAEALVEVAANAQVRRHDRSTFAVGSRSYLSQRISWLLSRHSTKEVRAPMGLLSCGAALSLLVACADVPDPSMADVGGFDFGADTQVVASGVEGRPSEGITQADMPSGTSDDGLASPTYLERLSSDAIVQGVKNNAGTVIPCLQEARASGALAPGTYVLALSWNILPSGTVAEARVEGPEGLASKDLNRCVSAAVNRWTFPASRQGAPVHGFPFGPFTVK